MHSVEEMQMKIRDIVNNMAMYKEQLIHSALLRIGETEVDVDYLSYEMHNDGQTEIVFYKKRPILEFAIESVSGDDNYTVNIKGRYLCFPAEEIKSVLQLTTAEA